MTRGSRRVFQPCAPASIIIEKMGGPQKTADAAEVTESQVYRWQRPEEGGGLGGFIPRWNHQKLIDAAKTQGIALTIADFYPASRDAA